MRFFKRVILLIRIDCLNLMNFIRILKVLDVLLILLWHLKILSHIFCLNELCIGKWIHLSVSFHLGRCNRRRVAFSWILNRFSIITFTFIVWSFWNLGFKIVAISNMSLLWKFLWWKISKFFFTKIHRFWRCMKHTWFRKIMRFSMILIICKLFNRIRRKDDKSIFLVKLCWNSKLNFLLNSLKPNLVNLYLLNHDSDFIKNCWIFTNHKTN